jgi:hypothetical protein
LGFTNTSSHRCTIDGYPGVSYVGGGNGTQVGAAADREQADQRKLIVLSPDQVATVQLRESAAGNFTGSCRAQPVEGLRIYPPHNTASVFVPRKTTGCANPKVHLLSIGPARAAD